MKKAGLRTQFERWALTNAGSRYVFNHCQFMSSIPFMGCDGSLTLKDGIALGSFRTLDSLSGAFFVASSVALMGVKRFEKYAFRANAAAIFMAIGCLLGSGLGYNPIGDAPHVDPGKMWAAVGFIPGATITLFEDEIGSAATYLRARSENLLSKMMTSVSRYPMIWCAGINLIATAGILQTGIQNFATEWPMIPIAMFAGAGNIGLLATDRRLRARAGYAQFWKTQRNKTAALAPV